MYMCVHVCVYRCMCVCMYMYIYMSVYMYAVFRTLACVCVGGLEVGFVSACSWLALVTGVRGYVLAGVEIGGLSCIFLYF